MVVIRLARGGAGGIRAVDWLLMKLALVLLRSNDVADVMKLALESLRSNDVADVPSDIACASLALPPFS